MVQPPHDSRTANGLRPNSLGVAGIVFFVVAAASPLSAVLGSSPAAIGLGNGAGAPSAYLAAGLLLLVFASGYSAMSRKVASGGGFADFIRAGLGERAGRSAGYLASLGYLAIQAGLYGIFGFFATPIAAGLGLDLPWYLWSLIAWAATSVFAYLDIDLSAKVLGVLMVLEVVVLLVLSLAILFQGGDSGINAASFTPAAATSGAFGLAMMFAFASFIGFEATAIYSEEAKDRDRTVPRATYVSVLMITVFLVFTIWSFVIGYGADNVKQAALADPNGFVFTLAQAYVGPWLSTVMQILLMTSFFAALLSFQNTTARYLRSLALHGWLPARLSATHPKFRSPHIASIAASAITGPVILIFTVLGMDPYATLFLWFVGVGTLAIILLQGATSVSVLVFFRRNRSEFGPWRTTLAPALGAAGLITAVILVLVNWPVLVGADTGFSQLLPWLIPLVIIIGLALPLPSKTSAPALSGR